MEKPVLIASLVVFAASFAWWVWHLVYDSKESVAAANVEAGRVAAQAIAAARSEADTARSDAGATIEALSLFLHAMGIRQRKGKPVLPDRLRFSESFAEAAFAKAVGNIEKYAPRLFEMLAPDEDEERDG
jgi:hypothetical protein